MLQRDKAAFCSDCVASALVDVGSPEQVIESSECCTVKQKAAKA
jgi:hypothetical protein